MRYMILQFDLFDDRTGRWNSISKFQDTINGLAEEGYRVRLQWQWEDQGKWFFLLERESK